MTRNIITGLDIGTTSVRVVVSEYSSGSKVPNILALVKRSSRGLRRGYIVNFEETLDSINEAVREAEKAAGVKIKRVFIGIGGITLESKSADGSVAISRGDSEVSEIDLNRAIEASEANLTDMSNRHIVHRFPLSYKLDNKRILGRPEGHKGNKLEVKTLFVTCSSQHLKDFIQVVEAANLIVEDIIAAPLAASLVTLSKLQKNAGCVLANIGSQTTSIVVFEEGMPISLHVFPIGSTDITNDIALGLKIPLEDAERVKKGESEANTTRRKLDEIIEARLSDIFEFVEGHLKKIGRSGLLPAGIIITGGGSGINTIESFAKQYFKLPARIALPSVSYRGKKQDIETSWSVAYGLCLFGSELEGEESLGSRLTKQTKKKFISWLKELLP